MNLARLLLLSSLLCVCLARGLPAQAPPRVMLGYYSAIGGPEVHKLPLGRLTHISHAFLAVDAQGKLVQAEQVPDMKVTAAAHREGVKVLLALGGGKTAEGLTHLVKDKQALANYVRAVVRAAAENDYDGIDLVWESPNNRATRTGFVALVRLLRSELDDAARTRGRDAPYLLTAMVPPSGHLGKWIDTGAVVGKLDWLNVAAYDMSGPWERTAGHHAPLLPSPHDPEKGWRSVSHAMKYWHAERGAPKHKLVLGVPLYGRALPVQKVHEPLDPAKQDQHGALPFAKVQSMIADGWVAMWDRDSKAPWLQPRAQGKNPLLVCYDDRNSIDAKAKWAQQQQFRGLYFWAIHQDRMPDGTHWLINAANQAWPR